VVSLISQFADDNLTLNISTGLAIAGVIVIARSIKLITKFQAAREIPARFIERNVSLRGKVHSVTEKGLEVEHVPIYLPVISPLLSKGSLRSYCMNEEVLGLGLARTAPVPGVLPNSRLYWRLHKQLHRAEVKAEKKGRGLWKEDSLWERTSKAISNNALFSLVKRIF
uniref:TNase-like domain-containing protein n=1 Tax=Amphilophus citrinellus TaxID=61819 RepID=A0A3Q0RIH2_AMPCI